jgi:hypothetical protein
VKRSGLWLGLWLAAAAPLLAQVTVDVVLDQEYFLPGETLPAAVRITNRSGQTLQLGSDPDWLTFSVESRDGYVVRKTGEVPVTGEFDLETSKRAIKRVDLAPYFNLVKQGRYAITATVNLKSWNRQINSQPKMFDVIQAARMWEREIGVPAAGGATNLPPEVRKFSLEQANHLRKNLMLYVRVTDPSGRLNRVLAIGPMLSFGQPDPQVDRLNNLHVLYQNGPHSFNYTVVNPDGEITIRRSYDFTTRPRLQADPEGNVNVTGGTLRPTPNDVGPAPKAAETNAAPPAVPGGTGGKP